MSQYPLYQLTELFELVTGYHATNAEYAEQILRTQEFVVKENQWDWLGTGVYFWKNDKARAWLWADSHYNENGVVLEVGVRLGFNISLMERMKHVSFLEKGYEGLQAVLKAQGKKMPENKTNGRHDRDCAVINYSIENNYPSTQTIECFFEEGESVYPGTEFKRFSSVQLCVRDLRCIIPPIRQCNR